MLFHIAGGYRVPLKVELTHTHIHTYTHVHTRTHTHIHTHTHITHCYAL